jgi:hypothetical protein
MPLTRQLHSGRGQLDPYSPEPLRVLVWVQMFMGLGTPRGVPAFEPWQAPERLDRPPHVARPRRRRGRPRVHTDRRARQPRRERAEQRAARQPRRERGRAGACVLWRQEAEAQQPL